MLSENTFDNQRPTQAQADQLDLVTRQFKRVWCTLNCVLPEGANKTLAYRHFEDACSRAKKAILFDQPEKVQS